MLKTVMVHQQKRYKFYNHNLSSLFQYLCIALVIKKLYEFEISTLCNWPMKMLTKPAPRGMNLTIE